ncbi:MAG TPA: four helix bundle protein [Atribacterota bacterium]|nr:four helix bundle protein [Atribacterota bacterium]
MKEKKGQSFQDLKIWQLGIEIVKDVYLVTNCFPKYEIYGLTSQIRCSGISIPSNIAEGFRRYYNKEYRQFLFIALGSCAELETQIIIASELSYLDEHKKILILEKINHLSRMISSLIKKIDTNNA